MGQVQAKSLATTRLMSYAANGQLKNTVQVPALGRAPAPLAAAKSPTANRVLDTHA